MYSIYTLDSNGGQCIYNDKYPLSAYAVKSPTLKMVDSSAGSLEMTLPPTNRAYDILKRMKTHLVVKRYDEEIWEGRVVEDTYDFQNNRKVYCEGALAYFNDTCQPQCEYKTTTLTLFLQSVIDIHNSKVPDSRKIYFDYQNVDSGVIDYKATQYQKTLEVLNSVCEEYGCHMQLVIKRVQTGTSVDPDTQEEIPIYERRRLVRFFKGVIGSSAQTVEFGKNLLEYSKNYDLSSLATVVLPLGAKKERSNSSQTGEPIDLTTAIEYTSDLGYGVIKTYSDFCTLQTKEYIDDLTHHLGPYIVDHSGTSNTYPGHYVAVLKVKASTEEKQSTVYISSRNYGGMGMYFFANPSNDYNSCEYVGDSYAKFASTSTGFTDIVDASVTVPYATAEHAEGWYWLFVGSFGGDIALRVNKPAEISDNLDEYYTVEDALVSSINLVSTIPAIEYGKIYCQGETNPGGTYDDSNHKFIRTTEFIQNGTGVFGPGLYSVRIATNNNHSIQARVIQYQSDNTFVASTDWISLPGRFDVTYTNGVKLKIMFKYGDTTQDFVLTGDDAFAFTAFEIVKGEKFGSLYVTSQSRNLFNTQLEQGDLIDSGALIGMPGSSSNTFVMRTASLLGKVDPSPVDGEGVTETGFTDDHTYLLSGSVTQPDPDFTRGVLCRIYMYDMDDDQCIGIFHDEGTDPNVDDGWGTMPRKFTVPQTCRLKFEFKYQHDSPISYAGLTDIMLEEDANIPSMYEPSNTSFEEYGWIETAITWDDITNPDDLYYRAKSYLASGQFDKMTLDVTALDLSVLGADPGKIELNNYIRVKSAPHGLDKYFEITEIDIPLAEPDNMKFQLGSETQQTFTSINNNQIGELVTKVDNQTSISKMIDTARKNAEAIIETGFMDGEMVLVTDGGQVSGCAFFKVVRGGELVPYTGQLKTTDWNTIKSDPDMSEVRCLIINTEGIAFYGAGLGSPSTITLVNGLGEIVANSILAGTMVAERIVGGTLHLGLGPGEEQSADTQDESGKLYAHCKDPDQLDANNNIKFLNNDRMVEMTKDVGIVQQGYNTDDGYTRQVRIDKGIIEGSVMYDTEVHQGDNQYHVGGLIRMATKWDHESPYGMEISAPNGPMVFSPCGAGIAVLSTNGQGNYGWGYNTSVTIDGVTLHFTHGWLTQVDDSGGGGGGGGGGGSYVSQSDFDTLVSKYNAFVDAVADTNVNKETPAVDFMLSGDVPQYKYPTS